MAKEKRRILSPKAVDLQQAREGGTVIPGGKGPVVPRVGECFLGEGWREEWIRGREWEI